ncbi:DsbA family oxidoreductase [Lacicoccus alkaliphilus]|uniref:Predicted dithiol-disulfide isomerase, DsbA family n=1 Tax=Lacicoccus alkaliphilus DSM 16010 TaxID=1123231 RepID=A0A1M7HGL6_9BACL|nr:DsbA family oxidoreductase [Salinicoccus alkaliphilus]SHM27568.1 Predicted dithiol-disulfide isomerase, DsbA family [Salinicoccus alkaliphilus DSM 16010]
MKITIWSDFVCPFCFIGQAHLDAALEDFEHKDEVEIEYKSYLLMPDAEYRPGISYYEFFADKFGLSADQAEEQLKQQAESAKSSGVIINHDIAKIANTFDTHRAFQYAKEHGKGTEFFKRFYAAHFTEGEVLSDTDTIVRISEEIGLEGGEVRSIVENKDHTAKVQQDISEAQQLGVQGVPFFLINDKYSISGAQPVELFRQALNQISQEDQTTQ